MDHAAAVRIVRENRHFPREPGEFDVVPSRAFTVNHRWSDVCDAERFVREQLELLLGLELAVAVEVRRLRFRVCRDHLRVRGVPVDDHAAQEDELCYPVLLRLRRDLGRQIGVHFIVQVLHTLVRRDVGDPGRMENRVILLERLLFPFPVLHPDRVDVDVVRILRFDPLFERIADITGCTCDQYSPHPQSPFPLIISTSLSMFSSSEVVLGLL